MPHEPLNKERHQKYGKEMADKYPGNHWENCAAGTCTCITKTPTIIRHYPSPSPDLDDSLPPSKKLGDGNKLQ